VALGVANGHCAVYTGSLSGAGLVSAGNWQQSTISWSVSTVPGSPGLWQYVYDLVLPSDASKINHLTIEAPLVGSITTTTGTATLGSHNPQSNLPDLTGIKFTAVGTPSDTYWHIVFTTYNAPACGDFYARNNSSNNIRNAGFTTPDSDPAVAAANGSVGNHILVPGAVVPIPATAWLLGAGLIGLATLRRKFKK